MLKGFRLLIYRSEPSAVAGGFLQFFFMINPVATADGSDLLPKQIYFSFAA